MITIDTIALMILWGLHIIVLLGLMGILLVIVLLPATKTTTKPTQINCDVDNHDYTNDDNHNMQRNG